MKLIDITKKFATEDDCLDYIEQMRWPNGEIGCVHCGLIGRVTRVKRHTAGKNKRARLYDCGECGKQFSTTSGTIFQDSHLPLIKWFTAIALICEAKKGLSACQMQRHLGTTYRTAWHLCHRIRQAMKQEGGLLMGVVETDETYLSSRKPRKGRPFVKKDKTDVVLGMIERGGRLRLIPVADATMKSIEPVMLANIDSSAAHLQTDESALYTIVGARHFAGRHSMINHSRSYGEGLNHTNTIESAFSLLKKGVYGSFHHVSIKHLGRYCDEFSYRFNRRGEQLQMFDGTMKKLANGEVLPYKKLTARKEKAA